MSTSIDSPTPAIGRIDPESISQRFAASAPSDIIRWAVDTFGDGLLMTSSFGAESMCLIHLLTRAKPDVRIVLVNTGYLFHQTLIFMEEMRRRYGLNVLEYHSHHDPLVYLTVHGETDPRIRRDVEGCCRDNKNEVFDRAMRELAPAAWVRGVRADQSATRSRMQVVQWNTRVNAWAISPLLNWNHRQIFEYMKYHNLPFHPLWQQGYTSIGCNPETCTRPTATDGDPRGGRWGGLDKKECGIHLDQGAGI